MHSRNNARARASKPAEGRRDIRSRGSGVIRRVTLLFGAGVVAAAARSAAATRTAGWDFLVVESIGVGAAPAKPAGQAHADRGR